MKKLHFHNPTIGWILLILGIYFLASSLGLIPKNFPCWGLLFIIIGVYILNKHYKKN